MKIKLHAPSFLIRYSTGSGKGNSNQSKIWDGKSLLPLGHPTRFVLQRKEDEIIVRDFTVKNSQKSGLTKISLSEINSGRAIALSQIAKDRITIAHLFHPEQVSAEKVNRVKPMEIAKGNLSSPEDKLFGKYLQRMLAATAVAALLLMVLKPSDPPTANEELIPKKYAKLILTKPKEKVTPSASASAANQSQVKQVARAMQSKTVQKSISSILKGGLTKYSIMSTGRSITSLSQKIQGSTVLDGSNLQNKSNELLASNHSGSTGVGSGNGYGAGAGTAVSGQGKGQLEIGLNTQDASVDEGLTKEEVAKVIHAHLSEIRYCYESAILKDPTLAGKVSVDFKINPTGMVGTSGVSEATLTDRQVGACLVGKLKSWKFPQPRGGVMVAVSYPFIFKSLSR